MQKLEGVSNLFEDFTGHRANWVEKRPLPKGGVWLKIGVCDFLVFENDQKLLLPKGSFLIISSDAKQFAIFNDKQSLMPRQKKMLATVKSIAYTTKRDGVVEKYIHDFKRYARPQIDYLTSKYIQSLGGAFDFTELGFVDNPKELSHGASLVSKSAKAQRP